MVVSLLFSAIVTPPAGAACDRLTANTADCPSPMLVLAGTLIVTIPVFTFTVAVTLTRPTALAVIVTEPEATPVTVTGTLVAPGPKLTLAGTVALLVSLEVRLTVKPLAGAAGARFSMRFPVAPTLIDSGDPVKLIVGADTVTVPLPEV